MITNHFKKITMLVLTGLLLTVFNPADSFAQKGRDNKKENKAKVVSPERQYKKLPRRGEYVSAPPKKTMVIRHGHYDYRFDDGVFYRPVGNSFVVTAPPVGIHVSILPKAASRLHYLNRPYFYYYGVFYIQLSNGGYEVVEPPLGARVYALPDGYEIFDLDGMVYYRLGETYYKAIVEDNGNVAYEVVRV